LVQTAGKLSIFTKRKKHSSDGKGRGFITQTAEPFIVSENHIWSEEREKTYKLFIRYSHTPVQLSQQK